jgi:hypothetical protein
MDSRRRISGEIANDRWRALNMIAGGPAHLRVTWDLPRLQLPVQSRGEDWNEKQYKPVTQGEPSPVEQRRIRSEPIAT